MAYEHILTDDEKRELLRIARATLREHFYTGRIPPGKPHRDSLTALAGVFVTLHSEGKLRGCIGTQQETTALFRAVQEMTIAAATRDPRFEPVAEGEVDDIEIEVSVLGNHQSISSPDQIDIGVHGLSISHQGKRGLLLPQVATENNWDGIEFLQRVCVKAGLDDNGWKEENAEIEIFTAQVFSDQTHPPKKWTL
ncbi:MAG: AmmeMemoRadiSam system protein A [Proteobacteria bacterium]|nr:AmmeMemoRadiSam system protein A [Pseudomonadota bacterium]